MQRNLVFIILKRDWKLFKSLDIKKQKIAYPPPACQEEITEILSSVDSKIQQEQNKKKALEELFKSMLNNLMTAKIRVKDIEVKNENN